MINTIINNKAAEFGCEPKDFSLNKNIVLKASTDKPFLRMISFGHNAVVSSHPEFYDWCTKWFATVEGIFTFDAPKLVTIGKAMNRYSYTPGEIFDYFLPTELDNCKLNQIDELKYDYFENEQITSLYRYKGFDNTLNYKNSNVKDNPIAIAAFNDSDICAIASATTSNKTSASIGIDVKNEYRKKGIASKIVNMLTHKILEKNIIPLYATWYSNIGSRKTAINAGYRPCWVELTAESIETKQA